MIMDPNGNIEPPLFGFGIPDNICMRLTISFAGFSLTAVGGVNVYAMLGGPLAVMVAAEGDTSASSSS